MKGIAVAADADAADADSDANINLPACGLLGTNVLRNQFQSCVQVLFPFHLVNMILWDFGIAELFPINSLGKSKIYHRVVGSEVHPDVSPSFL